MHGRSPPSETEATRRTGRTVPREYAMTTQDTRKKAGLFRLINWKPVRFIEVFVFLVLVILLTPFLDRTPLLAPLLATFFLNILIVCLSFAGFEVRRRWPLIMLWLLGPLFDWAALRTAHAPTVLQLQVASDLARTLLLLFCVASILRYVLTSHEVTLDTIFGAFVAYFMIAFAFATIFHVAAICEPASFSMAGGPEVGDGGHSLRMRLNYFSFVTIATVGYGDIVPRRPVTQTLAVLEAIIGQFYMAGLIAWLVGVHSRRGTGGESKHGAPEKNRP